MQFKMSLDTANVVSSVVVLAVLAVPVVVVPTVAGAALAIGWGQVVARLFLLGVVGLPLVLIAGAAIWAPSGLEITETEVRVVRRLGAPTCIPLASIAAVEDGPRPGLRLMGVSGFLGSFGLFSARDFGRFQLYATRRGPYVALRRKDGLPVVVTPDDPEHFRAMLARRLGGRRSDVG